MLDYFATSVTAKPNLTARFRTDLDEISPTPLFSGLALLLRWNSRALKNWSRGVVVSYVVYGKYRRKSPSTNILEALLGIVLPPVRFATHALQRLLQLRLQKTKQNRKHIGIQAEAGGRSRKSRPVRPTKHVPSNLHPETNTRALIP